MQNDHNQNALHSKNPSKSKGREGSQPDRSSFGRDESQGYGSDFSRDPQDEQRWEDRGSGMSRGWREPHGSERGNGARQSGGQYGQSFGVSQGTPVRGKGPKGYKRSDERIKEDLIEQLIEQGIDASEIDLQVSGGEVTFSGTVKTRQERYQFEQLADGISGVIDVTNNLRVKNEGRSTFSGQSSHGSSSDGGSAMDEKNRRSGTGEKASPAGGTLLQK